jgi:hypothetical protein
MEMLDVQPSIRFVLAAVHDQHVVTSAVELLRQRATDELRPPEHQNTHVPS